LGSSLKSNDVIIGIVLVSTFFAFGGALYAGLAELGLWAIVMWFYAAGFGAMFCLVTLKLIQQALPRANRQPIHLPRQPSITDGSGAPEIQ